MGVHSDTLSSICMLSTHGYVDPVPQLGRTDTGGQVVYVLELSKALSSRGVKVDIYTRGFDPSKKQVEAVPDRPKVRVIRIPAGSNDFIPKEQIYDVLPELTDNMIGFIRENDLSYDLFHGHYVDAGIVALKVAATFARPAFFTAHSLGAWKRAQMGGDPEEMETKFNFNLRIAEEVRIFKSVMAQSVTTELQGDKLEELYDFTSDNIVVIPPGVDVHTYRPPQPGPAARKSRLPKKYILCLSRIDSNKGHDLLLNAFDIVRKSLSDIDLVIAGGSPNPQQRELDIFATMRSIIDEKAMEGRVHIIGYVPDEDMAPLYQQAELFVLPSLFEPFGMTVLEAMACGTAVVASKFGGIRNVVTTGENGVLIDPSDPEEFSQAIVSILSDSKLAGRLADEGRNTIQRSYSWEAIADRHIAFYEKFLGTARSV